MRDGFRCESPHPRDRDVGRERQEGPSLLDEFPDKPKGMHWQTYDRLRRRNDIGEARIGPPLGPLTSIERSRHRARS